MNVRLLLAAAIVGVAATASYAPHAQALDLSWLQNDNYVRCLKYVSAASQGDPVKYDRGRRACNRAHFPNRPGTQY